ncbi:MAG: hypothetical protein RIQ79_1681 [Verrucomicrobiota bacterium]
MQSPRPFSPARQARLQRPSTRTPWLVSAACTLALLAAINASAANIWDGGGADGLWSTATNWDNDTVPTSPVGLTFGGTAQLAATNDLSAFVANGITFTTGAGAFTLSGNATSLGGNIENNSTSLQTITLPLVLTAGRAINTGFGNVTISGSISGAFDFAKTSANTLTLSGIHTYTGRTGVGNFPNGAGMTPSTHQGGGTLILDFSAATSPVSNLIYNGVTLTTTQELRLSDGTVVLKGKDATANAQTVGQLGVATGFNTVSIQPGAGGTVVLNAGAITLAAGAAADNNKSALVNFDLPAGTQDATNGITTSSLNTNGILAPITGNMANLVANKTSWATNATNLAGGNIIPLADASYALSTATTTGSATQNVDMVTDVSASAPGGFTLRFNNTGTSGSRTLTNTNATGTMAIAGGGILVTSAMGANDVTISGGNIRGNSNRGFFISNYNTGGGKLVINSAIVNNSNSNALTVGGGGVVQLGGNSSYTNGTYILKDTTLIVSSDANLGFGGGTVSVLTASTASPTVILNAAAPTNGSWLVGASFLGSTITTISGTTITLAGNANADIAAATNVSYASDAAISLDGGTLSANATFSLQQTKAVDVSAIGGDATTLRRVGLSALGGTISVSTGNTLTVNGVVSSQTTSGFGALTKTGTGTLVLSGTNTYAGGTTLKGGTLQVGATAALGSTTASLAFGPASAATLQLNGKIVTVGGLTGDSTAVIENSNATNGTLIVNTSRANTFAGTVQNGSAGLLQLTKQGTGNLTLSGNNTHGGDTLLSSGTIILGSSLALQSSTLNQQVGTGSGLVFDSSVTSRAFTLGGLKNNGAPTIPLQNNAVSPAAITLTLGNNNQSTSYSGVFTGPGGLIKSGSGNLTLSGLNDYSGSTIISTGAIILSVSGTLGSGPLTVNGSLDLTALSSTSYATTSTLAGTGVVNATGKTLQINGAFTPVDTFDVTGDVAFGSSASSTYVISSLATNDSLHVTGNLTLGGNLAITPSGVTFAAGQTFAPLYTSAATTIGLSGVTVNGLALTNAAGTWTATNTGLKYTFTESTGVLAVTSSGTALDTWRSHFFSTTSNTGTAADTADADGDGIPNLVEYATGTDPTVANSSPVTAGTSGGHLTLTFPRIDDPLITYTVKGRDDLIAGTWTTVVPALANNPTTGFTGVTPGVTETVSETVIDTVTLGAGVKRFLRLEVSY